MIVSKNNFDKLRFNKILFLMTKIQLFFMNNFTRKELLYEGIFTTVYDTLDLFGKVNEDKNLDKIIEFLEEILDALPKN